MTGVVARETSNPFSTRFTRPGAMPFLFPPGIDADELVARLAESGWWGQIVGPHGSGKSTLLSSLRPAIEAGGRRCEWFALGASGRTPRPTWHRAAVGWDRQTLVVVDGFEQLGCFARWQVRRLCRLRGCGLLVTSHRDAGLPPLFVTVPTPELAAAIVARLLDGNTAGIARRDIDSAFAARQGNVREMLFDLYDDYERRLIFSTNG